MEAMFDFRRTKVQWLPNHMRLVLLGNGTLITRLLMIKHRYLLMVKGFIYQ